MQKMRVYELAKEKKMSSKDMLVVLGRIGINVKSHMSVLEKSEIDKINEFFAPKDAVAKEPAAGQKEARSEKTVQSDTRSSAKGEQSGSGGPGRKTGGKKPHSPSGAVKKVDDRPKKPGTKTDSKSFQGKDSKDAQKQQSRKKGKRDNRSGGFSGNNQSGRRKKGAAAPAPAPVSHIKKITVGDTISVQELAKRMGKTANEVIKKLFELGIAATLNQEIDADTVVIVASEFGIETEVKIEKPITVIEDLPDPEDSLEPRPPVVTVMGHVDHGKTSLLDAIRETNVTASEAGGITQHIGAYQVTVKGKKITFLDTPGHEAFTAMRARGAEATDIAILVVAADDGVMPQTIEAINHSKAAQVPIIVAINKIDKPTANVERIKQQLTEHGLISEEWGGDTIFVPVSAKQKIGIDQLLEMVILVAEINELQANPNRLARGIVVEAELDKGRGPVATVLVQKGTLRIGDNLVIGNVYGKVRAMFDDKGRKIKEAPPSTPVEVLGLASVPEPGDIFDVIEDEKLAKEIAAQREIDRKQQEFKEASQIRLEDIFKQMNADGLKELNLVLKSDVHGSAEALKQSLERLNTDEVKVNIIHNGVGAISEADVMLAAASSAIIIGFNVRPDSNARRAAETEKVEIRLYRIIYEIIEDIKAAMSGLLEPDIKEVILGQAEVRALFKVPKAGIIAGSYVLEGKITNKAHVRVIRDGIVIHEGHLHSLKRFKDDAKEVVQGFECGIGIENFNDLKEGDIIEAFEFEEVKREL
ncbi:MAG: translation initiation factor IF-2 [Clostridia bacterium]|nr:translation initiation factor IF-2 [Clostridia bacterium]